MENKNIKERPGPSGESDLIIITPGELAKLGLFQDIQTTTVQPKTKNCTESSIDNTKQTLKKKNIGNLAREIVLTKAEDKIDVKGSVTLKSKLLDRLSNTLSDTERCQKILNAEKKVVTNSENQTVLNSKFLNKSLNIENSCFDKRESTAKLSWAHPPNKAPISNSSNSHAKILNSELKLEKHKFVLAQKKISTKSGSKFKKKSTDTTNVKNVTPKDSNKDREILNSKFTIANINTVVGDEKQLKNNLPFRNLKNFEETLRKGLNDLLQKSKKKLSNFNQEISEPPIIIEDSESDLEKPGTSVINEKNKSLEDITKIRTIDSQNRQGLEIINSTDNPLKEVIDLEKQENLLEPIIIPDDDIKKEVNIISNKSICLSNEELKLLASNARTNLQKNNPLKIYPAKYNEDLTLPVAINTSRTLYTGNEQITSDFIKNIPIETKDGIHSDLSEKKIDIKVINVKDVNSEQINKKNDPLVIDNESAVTQNTTKSSVKNKIVWNPQAASKLLVPPELTPIKKVYSRKSCPQNEIENKETSIIKDFILENAQGKKKIDNKNKSKDPWAGCKVGQKDDQNCKPKVATKSRADSKIDGPRQHDRIQDYQSKNIFGAEEVEDIGRNSRDEINKPISVEGAHAYVEQDDIKPSNECGRPEGERAVKNIIKDDQYVPKVPPDLNNDIIMEQERKNIVKGRHESISFSNKSKETNIKDSVQDTGVNMVDIANRRCRNSYKKGESDIVVGQDDTKHNNQPVKANNDHKTMEKDGRDRGNGNYLPNESISLSKKRERKARIITQEISFTKEETVLKITKEKVSEKKGCSNKVNNEDIKAEEEMKNKNIWGKGKKECLTKELISLPKKPERTKKIICPEGNSLGSSLTEEVNLLKATDGSETTKENSGLGDLEGISQKRSATGCHETNIFKISSAQHRTNDAKNISKLEKRMRNSSILSGNKGGEGETTEGNESEKNSSKMEGSETVVAKDDVKHDTQSIKAEGKKTMESEDTKVEGKETFHRSEVITLPKKRGRKSKTIVQENSILTEVENAKADVLEGSDNDSRTTQDTNYLDEIERIPKKRGRPRKVTNISRSDVKSRQCTSLTETKNDEIDKTTDKVKQIDSNVCKSVVNEKSGHCYMSGLKDKVSTAIDLRENHISEESLVNTLDGSQVEKSNASVELPKKRGRKKKIIDSNEIQENKESLPLLEKCNEEMVTSTPLPKKRGRKKKSSVIIEDFVEEPVILDESRNGRKRKKINYFEMENNITDLLTSEDDVGKKRRRQRNVTPDKDFEVKPKKFKNKFQVEGNTSTLYSNTTEDSSEIISEINKSDEAMKQTDQEEIKQKDDEDRASRKDDEGEGQKESEVLKAGETVNNSMLNNDKEDHPQIVSEIIDEDIQQNESEKGEDEIKQDEDSVPGKDTGKDGIQKKVKSKRTGESIQFLNSIFSAAVRNSSKNDSGFEENSSQEHGSTNIVVRNIDRRRRSAVLAQLVIDEDKMVTCTNCNEKINNDEWDEHNRDVHYNLSWREGEQDLNVDDPIVVTKILKPILKEDKELSCNKCKQTFTVLKTFIGHRDKCNGIVSASGLVTCAICKLELEKTKWTYHKQKKHNNLAWRIGDHPLNLNDKDLVLTILNGLYKAKKPLMCEKCGTSKKSVIGFLSHQAQCGLKVQEAQVKCEFCDKKVLPVSMPSHVKMVHETPKVQDIQQTSDYFGINFNATTSKREAARKAMLVIDKFSEEKFVQEFAKHFLRNIDFDEEHFVPLLLQKELTENHIIKCKFKDCAFETDKVQPLLDHMNSCENKPDLYYTCKKCLFICNTEDDIKNHIKTDHDTVIIEDDFIVDEYDDDEANENDEEEMANYNELRRKIGNEKKKLEKDSNYKVKPSFMLTLNKRPGQLFSSAYTYTMELCQEYFSQNVLFNHLRYLNTDWLLLDDELIEKYLPKSGESCEIARKRGNKFRNVLEKDYTFKKFEIFEAEVDEGIATIFCGGPIYAMAWLPTPYTSLKSKQILAVAAAGDFNQKYLVNEHYNDPCVIQFWDFDVLKNKQKITKPTLMFCLAHDFGPVWHLEWCPSGCLDSMEDNDCENKMSRMGLLAVAGSDSIVYIYSIPFLKEEQMGLIYKVKPLLKLCLAVENGPSLSKDKFYATKVSWSMGGSHRYVAVGYTDGMVGLFDLCTNSKLLKREDDDGDILFPYKSFQAHTHYISALSLLHLNGGNRWLMTGSFDRDTCVWDLSSNSKVSSIGASKRYIVSDGVWLTNWLAYVSVSDESSTNFCMVNACIKSYRDYMYERVYLTNSLTTIRSISSSNWLNGIIHGNSAGEIQALFPHQLVYSLDSEKHMNSYRYFFGCTRLIEKLKTPKERVAEEILKQAALKHVSRTRHSSESTKYLLNRENHLYNKYEPITYKEASEKYGLVFCDKIMDQFSDFLTSDKRPKYEEEPELSKANLYSMQAINKIAFNPNLQASFYYATGYQVGFVRLTYMKFLEKNPTCN